MFVFRSAYYVIYWLRNQILDCSSLERRFSARWPVQECLDAELVSALLDSRFHGVEPWNASNLHNNTDYRLVRRGRCKTRRQSERDCAGTQSADDVLEHVSSGRRLGTQTP